MNFNLPKYPYNIPFWMYDISNNQLITSQIIPSDIADSKEIVLVEIPVPGLNYQPVQTGGGGNRKLAFTMQVIQRNNTTGNLLMLKQFDMLRNQAKGFFDFTSDQFTGFPQVLFNWGVASVPLIYHVSKCDFIHKQNWTNNLGQPQYSEISMELILDENNILYTTEEYFRKLNAITGSITSLATTLSTQIKRDKRPY